MIYEEGERGASCQGAMDDRTFLGDTDFDSIHIQTIFHQDEVDSSHPTEVDSPFVGVFRREIDVSIPRAR